MSAAGATPNRSIWSRQPAALLFKTMAPVLTKVANFLLRYRGLLALCDQGLVSVTNFLTTMIVARVCGRADLGVYTLVLSVAALTTGLSATMITTPYMVLGRQMSVCRRRRYLGSLLIHQLSLSSVLAVAVFAAALVTAWTGGMSAKTAGVIAPAAALLICANLREFARGCSFADLNTGDALLVDIGVCLVQAIGLALLFYSRAMSVSGVLLAVSGASGCAACVWLLLSRRRVRCDLRLCRADLQTSWRFSKWVLGSALAWQGATYLYPWLLAAFHGTAATGIWAAASGIVAIANPLLLGLNNYLSPKIATVCAARGPREMGRYIRRASFLCGGMIVPFTLAAAIWGGRAVLGIYGNSYAGTGTTVLLLALAMQVNAFANPYAQGLFNLQQAKADMMINIVSVALLFLAGVPAARAHATEGAAGAICFSSCVVAAIRGAYFSRVLKSRPYGYRTFPAAEVSESAVGA